MVTSKLLTCGTGNPLFVFMLSLKDRQKHKSLWLKYYDSGECMLELVLIFVQLVWL